MNQLARSLRRWAPKNHHATKQSTAVECFVAARSDPCCPKNAPGGRVPPSPREIAPLFSAFLLFAFPFSALPARAQPNPLDLQLARETAVVTTPARREFSGQLDGFRDGRLFLRVATGGGEVGYSFAPAEIEKLVLPGADFEAQATELWERGDVAEALPLLEALGRQRLRYLPVLTETQRRPLWQLIRARRHAGDPLATISYVNQLRAQATDAESRALLRDAELEAHLQLGHVDEIRRLAAAWCAEADPAGESALGWRILAQLAYDAGDLPRARWTALQPVVFSSYLPLEHLDICYALAISAAHRLRDEPHASALYRDMQLRQLAWPATPDFSAIGEHYAHLAAPADVPPTISDLPPSEAPAPAAPAQELNRPLDQIRKLVSPAP